MAFPAIRDRAGVLFLAVAIGHIILISAQVNTRKGVPLLQAFVFGAFSEVQRGSSGVVRGVRSVWEGYIGLQRVHTDNLALKQRVRDLEVRLQRERALAGESEGLRRLLELRTRTDLPTRAAEVIGTSATADFRTVTIDRGTEDGVREDMAVLSPAGAVGRVVTPARRAAKVQLLVDRNAAAAVMVESSSAQGIVLGTGENLLRLEYRQLLGEDREGRPPGDVGHRRRLPARLRRRHRRRAGEDGRHVPEHPREAGGGFLDARAGAGGAGPGPRRAEARPSADSAGPGSGSSGGGPRTSPAGGAAATRRTGAACGEARQ